MVLRSVSPSKQKRQTQSMMDFPELKAKVSTLEWTFLLNAWKRYQMLMGLEGHDRVTQLWQCLSIVTGGCLCNTGLREELVLEMLIEESRKSLIGILNKLS